MQGWGAWRLLGLGLGFWVLVMAVVMPVTGAGFFATGLLVSPILTGAAYLMVFLGYSSMLVLARVIADLVAGRASASLAEPAGRAERRSGPRRADWIAWDPGRRALLAGFAGAVVAYTIARVVGREGGLVASSLPLATAPTRAANSAPAAASAAVPTAADQVGPAAAPTAGTTPVIAAPSDVFPTPPPARLVARDQGGSLTAAGRPKGTLAGPITPNNTFYIVTKNAVADPVIDAQSWRLVVDSEVVHPVQLDYGCSRLRAAAQVAAIRHLLGSGSQRLTAGREAAQHGVCGISAPIDDGDHDHQPVGRRQPASWQPP